MSAGPEVAANSTLVERALRGDLHAAALLMREIEDGGSSAVAALKTLHQYTGRAFLVGVTGPPGAGKSSLVDQLIALYRRERKSVGVVAVDPSSPFHGGALLGDRIRMNRHADDPGVFIRSMATRGQLGGLARSTAAVANVLDAMGYEIILIETVGVGQDGIDISHMADTTVVVTVPGLGDDIQAIKAGILEIADLFVVNKAERPDADRAVHDLLVRIQTGPRRAGAWQPEVLRTVANRVGGADDLFAAVERHRAYLHETGAIFRKRRERCGRIFLERLRERLFEEVFGADLPGGHICAAVDRMLEQADDPYTAAELAVAERIRFRRPAHSGPDDS